MVVSRTILLSLAPLKPPFIPTRQKLCASVEKYTLGKRCIGSHGLYFPFDKEKKIKKKNAENEDRRTFAFFSLSVFFAP